MLRFMARPLAEVLGLYVRGPVMSVPALFLMNAGCGAGGRVTDLAIVAGVLGDLHLTERICLADAGYLQSILRTFLTCLRREAP